MENKVPEIKNNCVKFIYNGTAKKVSIIGDFNSWQKEPLFQVKENEWAITKQFPSNARFDYKFIVNEEEILDPLNPNKTEGGFGFNSELQMPHFHYPIAIKLHQNIPHGTIKKYTVNSNNYCNYKRDVYLYKPYKSPHKKSPLLIFQDGLEYIIFGSARNTLDYLIHKEKIPDTYALFVDIRKENRSKEYSPNSCYGKFLVETIQFAEKKANIKFDKKYLVGTSLGGFVSVALLLEHPDLFNGAISQSGVFLFKKETDFGNLNKKIIYMDSGKYETKATSSLNILNLNKKYRQEFKKSGATVSYKKWNDGHSWGNWKTHLPLALKYIFTSGRTKPNSK
ncbi:MAG: alpha/beta hydrolase-fold protein [Caldisericota bacterium]|nr:alpha/beta hydrolase-fold protein [Caldisericota bacterium]